MDEICQNTTKNIIWGFEEPENSYEAKNIRKIKEDFQNYYSRKYQIFITTHTKEFLATQRNFTSAETKIESDKKLKVAEKFQALKNLPEDKKSSKISIYRVWKSEKDTSLITRFDEKNNTWDEICDDLGIIHESRIVDELQQKILEQTMEIQKSSLSLEQQSKIFEEIDRDYKICLENFQSAKSKIEEFTKPILYVEDTYIDIYMIAYLKIKNIDFSKDSLKSQFDLHGAFALRRACGAGSVTGTLAMNTTDGYDDKKVIGLYDYDEEGCRNFYMLKDKSSKKDWQGEILGERTTGYYRKRRNHPCFYALVLPIPNRLLDITSDVKNGKFQSFVEIENLIPTEKLCELNCVTEDEILDKKYYKIKPNIKDKAYEKFAGLDKDQFNDYVPLFTKIEELFELL